MHLKKILLALALPMLLIGGPHQVLGLSEEDELLSTAQRAFDDGFHDVAIRYLEEFLPKYDQSPKINQARLLLGQCYYFRNDYAKSLELFEQVTSAGENNDLLLFWTGEAHLKLSNYEQARSSYVQLLRSAPSSPYLPQALYSLGWSYFDQQQFAKAKESFLKLTAKFPRHQLSEDSLLKIAESSYNVGDYPSAIREFGQYLTLYPQSPHATEAQLNIADAHYYMENFTLAMEAYDRALKLTQDPGALEAAGIGKIWCAIKKKMYEQAERLIGEAMDFAKSKNLSSEEVLLARGHLFYEQGRWEEAVGGYDQLIRNFPSGTYRLQAYLGKANAQYALRKYPEAAQSFQFVLDHHSKEGDEELVEKARLGLGWALIKLGDFQKALRSFQSAFDRTTSHDTKANALAQMADAYHDAGKLNEAVALYEQVRKNYADSQWADYVMFRQGIALLKTDKMEEAQSVLEALQANFPSSKYLEDISYYRGVLQFKRGNWKTAASRMEGFLKGLTHPSDFAPEANYILALSYLNLKQYDDALKIFQKILRLYPDDETVAKNSDIGIAKCQFEAGQFKEAVKRFKLIAYKYPKTEVEQEALLWLAQYAMKNSQYDEAAGFYVRILERFPDTPQLDQVHYELGQAYEMQGTVDLALAQYKAVSAKDPALASKVKLAIAGIFSKEFDPQKAIDAYENIASTNPEYARDAYLKMAQLYRNNQNYEKEIKTYESALNIEQGKSAAGNAELFFDIADAYETMGRMQEAVDYYLKIPVQYAGQIAWEVKAYLRVAKIFEDRKDWEGAKVTYQKIIQLNTEESKYAQERLDVIKKK